MTPNWPASPSAQGDQVVIYRVSARYDEHVFPDPFVFDITRHAQRPPGVRAGAAPVPGRPSPGPLRFFFTELLTLLPGMELDGDRSGSSNFIDGITPCRCAGRGQRARAWWESTKLAQVVGLKVAGKNAELYRAALARRGAADEFDALLSVDALAELTEQAEALRARRKRT